MKIVSKSELVKMPKGTLFAYFHDCAERMWTTGPTFVLFAPCSPGDDGEPQDFYYTSIDMPDDWQFGELTECWDYMAANGASYPVNLAILREELHDPSVRYIVWESDDVARIINLLQGGDEDD